MVKLAKAECDILKHQTIDASGPGTILEDFRALLDFVGTGGIKTGGKNYRIPPASLHELDVRMTHPLRPKLQRPQQLSYPHLNGLYLLLRTTGLGRSSGEGASGRLYVPEERLVEWRELNPEEQYFTLLQAMLTGSWDVIDSEKHPERGPMEELGWRIGNLEGSRRSMTKAGKPVAELFYGWEGQTAAALLELFGILDLPRVEPQEGENWRISAITTTEFGKALLDRVRKQLMFGGYLDDLLSGGKRERKWVGELFRDSFPNCRRTLSDPNVDVFVPGVWQFKVSWGKVWRRIVIPADAWMDELAYAILDAFEFDDDHLYAFQLRNKLGRSIEITHSAVDDARYFTDDFAVGALPLDPGQTMTFLFDFGDNWQFHVQLEEIRPDDHKVKKAKVIAKKGKAPAQYGDSDWDDDW